MKKLTRLTAEQKARMPEIARDYITRALSTEPCDRDRVERGIVECYRFAGLKKPKIIWTTSPLAVVLAGPIAAQIVDSTVHSTVDSTVDSAVNSAVNSAVRSAVRSTWRNYIGGSYWAGWDAFVLTLIEFGAPLSTDAKSRATSYHDAKSAGWFWPHRDFVIVCDRAIALECDVDGRLHCENGPAVAYPDGFVIYSWHGVTIPRKWIEDNLPSSADALRWENLEQRRAACEMIGWHKILRELNARTIDADSDPQIGTLLEVDIPDVGREKFLRVLCGTGREFALPVPPDMTTALEAQGWIHDVPADVIKHLEIRT